MSSDYWMNILNKGKIKHRHCSSSFLRSPPSSDQQPPPMGIGSYKGNRESFYIRLLFVLAAIYDSTGSSDVDTGRREGSRLLQSYSASRNLEAFFLFTAIKVRLGVNPPCGPRR